MPVESGQVLSDRYELHEQVGRGGMGAVYRASDRVLGRTVAVKVLDLAGDAVFEARFRREAQAAAALHHPNVVTVHDTGSDGDTHYIVMEFVAGRTLADVLAESGPLAVDEAVRVASEVALALEAAHAAGIVHRDVKPSNILLGDLAVVKVADFGIARAMAGTTVTQAGSILGTVAFLAPEQARGDDVDGRADLYSLGCVLYAMLTGSAPFDADTPMGIAYQHLVATPPRPTEVRPEIGPDLEAVVLRALAKVPEQRYPDAQAFAADLTRAARGRGATTREATAVLPAATQAIPAAGAARGRRWSPVAAVAAVALASGLVVLALAAPSERVPEDVAGAAPDGGAAETVEAPPVEEPEPAQPPADPEEAAARIRDLLEEGERSGALTGDAPDELRKKLDETIREQRRGRVGKAAEKAEDLREKFEDLVGKGDVAAALAAELDVAIADLERLVDDDGDDDDD